MNSYEICYIEGVLAFHSLDKPSEKYDRYDVTISIDEDNREILKSTGAQTKVKYYEPNKSYQVSFGKPATKAVDGVVVKQEPPTVMDKDKNEIDASDIAHGSKVVCKLIVYNTPKGKGTRLVSVMVTEIHKKPPTRGVEGVVPF